MRELFHNTAERLFADHVDAALITAAETGQWPAALWTQLEEYGLTRATVGEDLGGAAASWSDAAVIVRAAGRHALPLPLPETMFANWLLERAGLALPGGPLSFGEGGAGSIVDGRFHGTLTGVAWGAQCSYVLTVMPGAQPLLVMLAVQDAVITDARNVALEPRNQLTFTAATPVGRALLPANMPPDILMIGGAMLRSVQIAGALERVLDTAIGYANDRVQFGRSIGKFQTIQHYVAQLAEQCSLAIGAASAACAAADPVPTALAAGAAKSTTSEAAGQGANIGHSVLGAIGFTYEHSLQFSTRRLWSWRSEFGSQTYWADQLGRRVAAGGGPALWKLAIGG